MTDYTKPIKTRVKTSAEDMFGVLMRAEYLLGHEPVSASRDVELILLIRGVLAQIIVPLEKGWPGNVQEARTLVASYHQDYPQRAQE